MHIRPWLAVTALTAISFVAVYAQLPRETWATMAALSLACGVGALTLMGAAALLGARWRIIELPFGGLDRVYLVHKWLAVWALALASVHLVFKAGTDAWTSASILSLPPYYTRLVRQLSYVALMFIVMLALNRAIRYSVWRWWHKLSGPLFLIVILHWLSFKNPIPIDSFAGAWLAGWSTLGIAGAAYKLLLYPFLSSQAEYRVVRVSSGSNALHLELEPVAHPVAFEPGQFAFLRMKHEGLREPHPFTIASGGGAQERVHFVIRALGDYTHKLAKHAAAGMHADVYAPYGTFRRPKDAAREIWIGGGVGISPFIAWLTDPAARDLDKATLFYFYTPGREFPSAEVLSDLARERELEFVGVPEGVDSLAFIERFRTIVEEAGPERVVISVCGPKGLLDGIRALMLEHHVPERNLRYEHFQFR